MDNKEAIVRLQLIDFERSNPRERMAIHHAITMLERLEKIKEILQKEIKENESSVPFNNPCFFEQDIVNYINTGEGLEGH